MSDRVWAYVDTGWRALLAVAVLAFGAAAVATDAGADALARFAGTTAWACAVLGATTGILVEIRRPPE